MYRVNVQSEVNLFCLISIADTAFKQQRLPAWQPILTAGTVLPAFFIIGIIFVPLGVGFLVTSNKVSSLWFAIDFCH